MVSVGCWVGHVPCCRVGSGSPRFIERTIRFNVKSIALELSVPFLKLEIRSIIINPVSLTGRPTYIKGSSGILSISSDFIWDQPSRTLRGRGEEGRGGGGGGPCRIKIPFLFHLLYHSGFAIGGGGRRNRHSRWGPCSASGRPSTHTTSVTFGPPIPPTPL